MNADSPRLRRRRSTSVLFPILFFTSRLLLHSHVSAQSHPAFPGAVGFGANSTGGRTGTVIFVTNTNNSGTGSLRDACEASGRRIVVFRTGGLINLNDDINIED